MAAAIPKIPSGFKAHVQRSGRTNMDLDKPAPLSIADLEEASSDSPMSSSPSTDSIPSMSPMPSYPPYGSSAGGSTDYYSYSPLSSPLSPYASSPGSCYFSYTAKSSSTGPIRVQMPRPRSLSSPVTGSFPFRRNNNLASSPLGRASDRLGMVTEGDAEDADSTDRLRPVARKEKTGHARSGHVESTHRVHSSSQPLPFGHGQREQPTPRLSVSIPIGGGSTQKSAGYGTSPLSSPLSSTRSSSSSSSSGLSCSSPTKLGPVGSFPIRRDSRPSPLHAVLKLPEADDDDEEADDDDDDGFDRKAGSQGMDRLDSAEESLGFGSMDFAEDEEREGERTVRSHSPPEMVLEGKRTPTMGQRRRSGYGVSAMMCD